MVVGATHADQTGSGEHGDGKIQLQGNAQRLASSTEAQSLLFNTSK